MTHTQATAPDTLLGSTLAGTYILDKVLGEGSMGRVYLARHTRIAAKRFAIKVLHEEYAQHHEALERFKREAEAAALISSPHVVGVHDYGRAPDGRPYLVSDFLIGEELADRLHRDGQLPLGEAVRVVRQICAGLAVAHANGVTHRDVKPENVFLVGADEELTAKLLDFGISRFRGAAGKALTMAGTALGTPDYMSPEQARGMPVDHRSDIYAVGVLLYVTLTGVMPFERDSPHETLLALLQEEAPPIRLIDPSIPEPLEGVIQKAMAKNADERYPWIAQLSQALAPYDPSYAASPASQAPPPATAATTLVTLPPFSAEAPAGELPSARRWLLGAFALGAPATFVALLLAVVGLLAGADVDLDLTVWLVVAAILLLGMGPPLGVALRHVSTSVWGHGARESALARVLRPTVLAAGTSYAFAALVLRLAQAMFLDDGAWPLGDTMLAGVALLGGVIALVLARNRG